LTNDKKCYNINNLKIGFNEFISSLKYSYNIFEKSGDLINTGPTGANVSDLMILLTKK